MKNILKKILAAEQLRENVAWKRHHYVAGTVIVKKGEVGKTLFFLEKGMLRVSSDVKLNDDKQINAGVSELDSGSLFGEICLHQSQIRMATVTAVTDVDLLEIDGQALSVYLDDNPIMGYLFYKSMFEIMVSRIGLANQRIENLTAWGLKAYDSDGETGV